MPVANPIDALHQSSPAYQVAVAQAVAASGTHNTLAVNCEGYERAAVLIQIDTAHSVQVQASLDEVTWFSYAPHADTPAPVIYAAAGGINTVRRVELAGVRYLRAIVANTAGTPATLNAWITLQSVP